MSQSAEEPEPDSGEPADAGHVFSDDPALDDAIWETLLSDFTSDDW